MSRDEDNARHQNVELVVTADELIKRYSSGERDFSRAKLEARDLRNVNLSGANFRGVSFAHINLSGADLSDANLMGASFASTNLTEAKLDGANLDGADLRRAFFTRATLRHATLRALRRGNANFEKANLSEASFQYSMLGGAGFRGASLQKARFDFANLTQATLDNADLEGANLDGANFTRASLKNANLDKATVGRTILVDVELREFCRAELEHRAESTVDYRSILRSLGEPQLKKFLRGTGLPDLFVEYTIDCAKSVDPNLVFSMLQTVYICYDAADEAFARKLNHALKQCGVRTYFFEDDAMPGDRTSATVSRGIYDDDRVIVVCSDSSSDSADFLTELQETIDRESKEGASNRLVPIRIGNFREEEWRPKDDHIHLARALRSRVSADFSKHEDSEEFRGQVSKLIAALKKPNAL